MDSNLRTVLQEAMNSAQQQAQDHQDHWLSADNDEYRRDEYQHMIRQIERVNTIRWVLGLLDTVPVSTRPPSAAERIEAWLALHPEDNALSHRELAGRVGLSKTAVAKWRKLSTSVHNAEPVLE